MRGAFEDKVTQVMARCIPLDGSRNETYLQEVCLLASRKGVRPTRFAESYSGYGRSPRSSETLPLRRV